MDWTPQNDVSAGPSPASPSRAVALGLFSGGVTGLAPVICFFSLISSMVANAIEQLTLASLGEQAKDIGILRVLGTTWHGSPVSTPPCLRFLSR